MALALAGGGHAFGGMGDVPAVRAALSHRGTDFIVCPPVNPNVLPVEAGELSWFQKSLTESKLLRWIA